MATLARRVGLGLNARGDVAEFVRWADRARSLGIESVWIHDSYFERDAVTYASAVAAQVEDIKIGLGALNPFTRHPVLIAMTISALDEMAPERILLGMGSALPLRLGQMGIPYTPPDAVTKSSDAIDTLHTLWKGERIPSGTPGLPPLQPMFPPVHRVPIYLAAYRGDEVRRRARHAARAPVGRADPVRAAGPPAAPADVPAGAPRPDLSRWLSLGDHGARGSEGRRIPRAPGRIDPGPEEAAQR